MTFWEVQEAMSKFGYKCIQNRHELCKHEGCLCICHRIDEELESY